MNEQFYALPDEKQMRIINAGFEVFASNEYKHASTDLIASKAGISKGLLFYYFHNKKSLYLFLYEHACHIFENDVLDERFKEITDFFDLCAYGAKKKYALLQKSPHIVEFITKAFYSQKEDVSEDIGRRVSETMKIAYEIYFSKIDFSKFREDVSPQEVYAMLTYMTDGCLHNLQRKMPEQVFVEIFKKFDRWAELLKRVSYKEEYL